MITRKDPKDTKILVVGGGIGGMAVTVALKRQSFNVELIDIDPDWRVYGAGITMTGTTIRAYNDLDPTMVDDIAKHGAITNGVKLFSFKGHFIKDIDEAPLEDGLPATGGIMRPVLHQLMQQRVKALDVPVKLGVTVDNIAQGSDSATVTFSDATTADYDLVIGSDGVNSKIRELAFANSQKPKATGQGCWRIAINRRPGVDRGEFYFGYKYPAGITACGPDSMYLWMLTPDDGSLWVNDEDGVNVLRTRLEAFGGTVEWIKDNMTTEHWVNYRPLEAILQPKPWSNGQVVLLGDSAHATTPHLASGAGMAVESAVVLSQELANMDRSIADCLDAYTERRYERCRDVVESSVAIGDMQQAGAGPEEVGGAIGAASHRLMGPY